MAETAPRRATRRPERAPDVRAVHTCWQTSGWKRWRLAGRFDSYQAHSAGPGPGAFDRQLGRDAEADAEHAHPVIRTRLREQTLRQLEVERDQASVREDPVRKELRLFVEAVRSGAPSPIPGSEGRANVAVAEAAYESAARGAPVVIGRVP